MPILYDETELKYKYSFDSLTQKSSKFVACQCDVCSIEFQRRRKDLTEPLVCLPCQKTPDQKKKRAAARAKTMQERYNGKAAPVSAATVAKRRETNIAKYGGPAPQSSPEIRAKTKQTLLDTYNVTNVSLIPGVRERAKQSMIEEYGVPYPMMSPDLRAKSVKTCLDKYGVKYNTQSDVMKQKSEETRLEKYGVRQPSQSHEILRKMLTTRSNNGPSNNAGTFGAAEDEVADFIKTLGITDIKRNYVLSDNRLLDIVAIGKRIAIEYNGLYWHNELSKEPRDSRYHISKMRVANKDGYRLISIFEDEWLFRRPQVENALKSIFGVSVNRIGARECSVKAINISDANTFLEANHIQGAGNNSLFAVGLFHEGALVGVLTLGRHPRQGHGEIVLNRMCFDFNCTVMGGASRMLKIARDWAKTNGFSKMISWSDNRWFTGSVYEKMGFSLAEELDADFTYVLYRHPTERLSKQSQTKKKTNCPIGLKEHEWAKQRGLARVWDCGKKRWELTL